jgi:hypothetical protein
MHYKGTIPFLATLSLYNLCWVNLKNAALQDRSFQKMAK